MVSLTVRQRRVKYACYTVNLSMAVLSGLPPLLFVTFHTLYSISYTMLGLLVLINFCTQLSVDLLFSFFSHRFPLVRTVRMIPVLTAVGFVIFGLAPVLMPRNIYPLLALGTVVYSASSGLNEVLTSPVIAALPSDNPDRDMSRLHSVYAWGLVAVVILNTLLLRVVGPARWPLLMLPAVCVPVCSAILFANSDIPALQTEKSTSGVLSSLRDPMLLLCIACIFCSGASECTMDQWSSTFLEKALGLPKVAGDIFGVALFAAMMGLGRSLYARWGRNAERVLLYLMCGTLCCYLTAALSPHPIVALAACALTGLCTSMLWPGSLLMVTARRPDCGVAVFALMAAGADLGASVGPQLVGLITDAVAASSLTLAALTPEQLGMKAGMLAASLFPLAGILILLRLRRVR